MNKKTNNLIGKCGFYCGSCPTYAKSECTGCRTAHKKGDCYTLKLSGNKFLINYLWWRMPRWR